MMYEDIRITITAKVKDGHRVLVDSPAGDFAGFFVNRIDRTGFDNMLIDEGLKVKSLEDARSKKGLKEIRQVKSTDKLSKMSVKNFLKPYFRIKFWMRMLKAKL
jgi:hypothetical protein